MPVNPWKTRKALVADLEDAIAAGGGASAVSSVNGRTGAVTLTKADVSLSNVDNTSDASKPVSTATQTALDGKQPMATVLTNTTAAFTSEQEAKLSGIATGATANDTDANLKSRANHTGTQAISTVSGLQAALDGKEPAVLSGTTGDYYRGDKTWATHDKSSVGLGNVDNTSDLNKPISTAVQAALDLLGGGAPPTVAKLALDQATGANTTPVSLTGLSFSYEALSTYRIWFMGRVSPAAATTGCGFQFDVSSAVTSIDVQFFHQLASTGTLSGGHSIADDASVGVSSGMPGTSTYPVTGFGLLVTGDLTGTAQLRFRSETTAITTCKAGFTLVVEKIS